MYVEYRQTVIRMPYKRPNCLTLDLNTVPLNKRPDNEL